MVRNQSFLHFNMVFLAFEVFFFLILAFSTLTFSASFFNLFLITYVCPNLKAVRQ